MWQDWWENGDLKPGVYDTSGESLGMNHAAYIKLRGAWVRMAPPIPTVKWVTIGSTDYSMWNEWTIGKARYIDRDNGNGVFVEGDALSGGKLSYATGAMALPKLWAGPGWQTGLSGNDPLAGLYGTDWAFAAKLESRPSERPALQADRQPAPGLGGRQVQPMLTGDARAARGADHSVALATRFRGINATLDGTWTPVLAGLALGERRWWPYSSNYVNPDVRHQPGAQRPGLLAGGLQDRRGRPARSPPTAHAGKVLVELIDPLQIGLSAKLEYFNIGAEYNAVMGVAARGRRAAHRRHHHRRLHPRRPAAHAQHRQRVPGLGRALVRVLYRLEGRHRAARVRLRRRSRSPLEGTYIGYNTNTQGRDMNNQYPDFLYTNGFTDTTAFTADVRLRQRLRPRQGPAQRLRRVPGPRHLPGACSTPSTPCPSGRARR